MRVFAWLFLLAVGAALVGQLFLPSEAQAMDQASTMLWRTERDLKSAVTTTAKRAQAVEQRVESPDRRTALPKDLQEFSLSTQRLSTLRENLAKDIAAYDDARNKKLEEFNQELAGIADPTTRRAMENLRRHAEEQAAERLGLARAALAGLEDVLAQGADLQHAARCVMIADEFNAQGQELEATVRAAKTQATNYAQLTSDLLSRITRALAS